MSKIFVLSPDKNSASGGIKILYRHVDVLIRNGYEATILHQNSGFRCTWFSNSTPVTYLGNARIQADDILVIPEIFGPSIYNLAKLPQVDDKAKKVIFNQNCRYTFLGQNTQTVLGKDFQLPYSDTDEYIATIVVSEDSRDYIQSIFPAQKVFRIHNAINIDTFRYKKARHPQICYMPRKNVEDAIQVLGILNIRGALDGVKVVAIDNMNEQQVAETMQQSTFFLSFGYPEGCPLPPAEAMACGCIVIGYDGFGGREYFKEEFSYPVQVGDIIKFADITEKLLQQAKADMPSLNKISRNASNYVRATYSSKQEEEDILACWESLLPR